MMLMSPRCAMSTFPSTMPPSPDSSAGLPSVQTPAATSPREAALDENRTAAGGLDALTVNAPALGLQLLPAAQAPAGYEVLERLGKGGMGVVYKARHLALDRLVALKMILRDEDAGAEERERFRREAEAV